MATRGRIEGAEGCRFPVGASGPLTLEISQTPSLVTGRVVRCQPAADPGARAALPLLHDLALKFLSLSSEAQSR